MKCAICGREGLREAKGEAATLVLQVSNGLEQRHDLCSEHLGEWWLRASKLLGTMMREWSQRHEEVG